MNESKVNPTGHQPKEDGKQTQIDDLFSKVVSLIFLLGILHVETYARIQYGNIDKPSFKKKKNYSYQHLLEKRKSMSKVREFVKIEKQLKPKMR